MNSNFILIAIGIVFIIGGYMVKQQRWLAFHFGRREVKVDIPKFTQCIYKFDYLIGVCFILIGILSIVLNAKLIMPIVLLLLGLLIFEIYAEIKYKIK